jgi:hypothetical protein
VYALAGLAISRMPLSWAIVACATIAAVSLLIVWRRGYLKMSGLRGEVKIDKK